MRKSIFDSDITLNLISSSSQTDDTLPFRNSLLGEYAMLMAEPPLGLGLPEYEIKQLAESSLQCAFAIRR